MIQILTPCDSFKHFDQPIAEFLKRLGKDVKLNKIKPSKRGDKKEIVREETQLIEKILQKQKGYIVLLYIDCKQLSTQEFYDFIEDKKMTQGDIIFIIGGAYGVDLSKIETYIDKKISLSPMTFPHAQAIMMLLEQIYRVGCIKKWIKYHH